MSGRSDSHKSHVSSKRANSQGWSRIPDDSVRAVTKNLSKEVGVDYMKEDYMVLNSISLSNSIEDGINNNAVAYSGNSIDGYGSGSGITYQYNVPVVTWGRSWYSDHTGEWADANTPDTLEDYSCPSSRIQVVTKIIKEKEVTNEVSKRTLFRIYVIDPRKAGKILMDGKLVVAENENQALLKVGVSQVAEEANLELEQVDVFAEPIAQFIRPRKEVQIVRNVSKHEED